MSDNSSSEHYQKLSVQPWDAMAAWLSLEQLTGFYLGNAIKYLARFNMRAVGKGGLSDLEKARDYLDRLLELERDL